MYTILIDESGDTGLTDVMPDPSYGPTQYFCLSAVIFKEDNRLLIEEALSGLPFKKTPLHAQKLSHFEKVHFCRQAAELPIGLIGVISNKLSLLEYFADAKKTPTHYYNKCTQYLLEMIGSFLATFSIPQDQVKIILETRNQRYDSLLAFVQAIQRNPLHPRAELIQRLNAFSISNAKKADDKCFALADLAANALFSAVRRDPRSFALSETRYLVELAPVFLANNQGRIFSKGIKPIHCLSDLGLPNGTLNALEAIQNPRKDFWCL